MAREKLRVLLVASHCDPADVGEAFNAHQWARRIASRCDLTLLTQVRNGRQPPSEQFAGVRVIEWSELDWFRRYERFNAAVKPWYPHFYVRARRVISDLLGQGERFDVFHQLTPIAPRYPSPCRGWGVPYILGPLSGGLATPEGFVAECRSSAWYMHLRDLDQLRLRFDPLLRRSYAEADVLIGAAPYVCDILSHIRLKRFEVECEVGIDCLARVTRQSANDQLNLLYVGRAVRTKGLRDAVRAIAHLQDRPEIMLTAAGGGPELEICREEAARAGVADRINFLGVVPRQRVEELYEQADIFVFPSFREPTGGVILEAMRHGLPIITTDIGGPGYIVTDKCGIGVTPHHPAQFAADLADAIRRLADDLPARAAFSQNARTRVAEIGLWDRKIDRTMGLYRSAIKSQPATG